MFVKKLVDLASKKPGSPNCLKANDINPRLVFHYGIPAGSISLAYDSIQKILAISTADGRIKLYGKDNTQALLESDVAVPSKFLQFLENQGILLNVTVQNHIEVWEISTKKLSHVHILKEEITSFMVMQHSCYMYIGDSLGNISVLKLDQEPCRLIRMQYNIPFSASHGNTSDVAEDNAVMYAFPQPTAESRRVLIIFRDGLIVLWGIQESKAIFITGGNTLHSLSPEVKKVTSACWACSYGSKVVVGYNNGEISLWSIHGSSTPKEATTMNKQELYAAQNIPICKLNLGYKAEKVPIVSLRWIFGDGRASRLYVNGASDCGSSNSFQIILLNENAESRIIKLALPLPDCCVDMEIISSISDRNKHKLDVLLLLSKSGHLYGYDDSNIEKYLLQCQSKSPPSLPNQEMVKVPFGESTITVAKFVTDNSDLSSSMDQDRAPAKNFPSLFPIYAKEKDGDNLYSTHFSGFAKIKNLYITGHSNGAINFWDASCPFLLLILSVRQQREDDHSLSGIPVTALSFDSNSRLLVSGDQHGMVRIIKFKPEQNSAGNNVFSLQATTRQGCSQIIDSLKIIKVNGAVLSICVNLGLGHLVVGSDEGYVSIIDMEGLIILSQKRFSSELYTGIISLQFENYRLHGSEKNVLFVALKDSSVLALEGDTGNMLSSNMVCCKKPTKALLMQILDGQDISAHKSYVSDATDLSKGNAIQDAIPKQSLLLLCSEKAVRLYSLMHVVQGVKKVHNKKKLHGICCWASTFHSPFSDSGLILLFTNGRIEIRSLPELSLLKETSLRGFTFSSSKSSSNPTICSSSEGETILVNGDQEILFVSLLFRKEIYRHLDSISQIYKDVIPINEGPASGPTIHKEKKKGIFSIINKDVKGNKAKLSQDTEAIDSEASIEELSAIFSTANFPFDIENRENAAIDENDVELNIDDIDLEDPSTKPKGQNILMLNKRVLNSKFQAIKGKLKSRKVKSTDNSGKEEHVDETTVGSVDQIKKRYGYPLAGESSIPRMAESKLNENLKKLQGINNRTTVMQDTAQSFSSMAKELLRTTEKEKRSS
ncbi:transducin/WD40 repeat-like superfamily protein isoform X2 [Tasmannia lanceolata]|uniref:transducin/WD40 repeat-like superfamily protein isoform X2 n=1 Tax=Tasmannia lanceolata TaxID=3420 RepID=UPI0040643D52